MISYDGLIAEWQGKQVTKYGSQCVALIAEFQAENNKPIIWADAAQWANHPQLKAVYTWVVNDPNNASQLPNRGDIIIWDGRLPYTNGSGHIAFYDHNLGNHQMMTFGQNSGGPTAHFQPHSWDYVAGWYVVTVPAVAHPAPAPAHPYQVVESFPEGRQFKVHPGCNKWGMNYDNLAAMEAHPVNTANENTTFIAVEKVHHQTGGMYYRAANDPDGWNVVDCDAFVAPPPPPPPYVPPAAPLPVPTVEKYELLVPVTYYKNAPDAKKRNNPVDIADKGTYILLSSDEQARELLKSNTDTVSLWVNDFDNKAPEPVKQPEPTPAPAQPTPETAPAPVEPAKPATEVVNHNDWKVMQPFHIDRSIEWFESRNDRPIPIKDLDGRTADQTLQPFQRVPLVGTFWKDGHCYGRTKKVNDLGLWLGVPMDILVAENEVYDTYTTPAQRLANGTAKVWDYAFNWVGQFDHLIQDVRVLIKERKVKK